MAFAGLWESWRGPKEAPLAEPLLSFTFATTEPNAIVAPIRNRMPVLLSTPEEWDAWLSPDAEPLNRSTAAGAGRPAPDLPRDPLGI
jgi:putative SOS response-associated peptidase YedK